MDEDLFDSAIAEHGAELLAASRAVAAAVYSSVRLMDRLRVAEGEVVTLAVGRQMLTGTVDECAVDGLALRVAGESWVVPAEAIDTVRNLPAGHLPPAGALQRELRLPMLVRRHCPVGARLEVAVGRSAVSGTLVRVGADHVECRTADGPEVVGLAQVRWIRCERGGHPA